MGRLGPVPEYRRAPPISIAILGPWGLRHKETPTILVKLPLATRLLWVLLSVHSRILPTPDLAANKKKTPSSSDPTMHRHGPTCHGCDATDTAVDQAACLPGQVRSPSLESAARTPRTDAMQRPRRQQECLISSPIPSHPIHPLHLIPTRPPTPTWPLVSLRTTHHAGCYGCRGPTSQEGKGEILG